MNDSGSKNAPLLKRRTLLTTMGASAVAGCSTNQEVESTDEPEPSEAEQDDCIDRSKYEELQNQYENLQEKHEKQKQLYEDLVVEHEELQSRYRDLEQRAILPPYIINNRRKTRVTFENTNGEIEWWEWDSSVLQRQNAMGNTMRRMTYSQLEYLGWDQYGFEASSKYTQLGDFGRYYQLNPFVTPSTFTPIAEDFYNRHESDLDRIREAWNFITGPNDYVAEITETPRLPLETLLFGGGDCEDSCILLGSILYNMPGITPSFWWMDADNPMDPQEINHVVIGVETNSGEYIIETTSSNTMLPYNGVSGFSAEISPT